MKINPTFSRWFPVVLWAVVIFIASANPDPFHLLPQGWITFCQSAGMDLPDCNELLGRFSHTAEYAVLAALLARALVWQGKPQIILWVIVLGISELYALSDEIHQLFVPGRQFQLQDLGFDLLGGAIGLAIFAIIRRRSASSAGSAERAALR
jgi:VanZ family protein